MNNLYGENPCKDCEQRRPGCHGDCEQHRQWKEELNSKKTRIYHEKLLENKLDSFEAKRRASIAKRR